MSNSLAAIILCGGKSSRMGRDKGLIEFGGKPLISYSISLIRELLIDEVIIIANQNHSAYKKYGYPVIEDFLPGNGPMGGIYSGLKSIVRQKAFVFSCDMPFLSKALCDYLLQHKDSNKLIVPKNENEQFEPLCAIYDKILLDSLEQHMKQKRLKLQLFIQSMGNQIKPLPIHAGLDFYTPDLFQNFNTLDDVNASYQ